MEDEIKEEAATEKEATGETVTESGTSLTEYAELPSTRKYVNVAIIWFLFMPVGVILMWSGPVYRNKTKNGKLIEMPIGHKIAFTMVPIILFLVDFLFF